ncbi:hypothetical protein F9U64_02515 [Gracilibacillus oryzae]|uniref:Uncharacterized protein n=1 Tax=Gracilibacillus oryzae TaxID=1672701 RepID=A0A7C8GVD5_9BACI|nr:hypothetical protein [Gracilibacillus oryzae]KAB8138994.1 hypothetical protein F9U64_02515 [Gracilibacillus oryzae]
MRAINILKDEKGNASIITLGIVCFGIILIFLFFNYAKIFIVAERSNTSAEQASLAATSVVYDEMLDLINTFQYACGNIAGVDVPCPLKEKYELMKASNPSLSEHEAIDKFLSNSAILSLRKAYSVYLLEFEVQRSLLSARPAVENAVQEVVEKNKGNENDTIITYFNSNNRIEVETSAEYESMEASFLGEINEDIENVGMGLEIKFLDSLNFFPNQTF